MTDKNTEKQDESKAAKGRFQEEFNALPLDEKFASLLQMEVATLNEAFTYVANSSMKAFEKVGDAISDLGSKIESDCCERAKGRAGESKKLCRQRETRREKKALSAPSPKRLRPQIICE